MGGVGPGKPSVLTTKPSPFCALLSLSLTNPSEVEVMTHVKQMESPRSREPLSAPKDTQLESPHNPVHVTPEPTFSLSAEKGRR